MRVKNGKEAKQEVINGINHVVYAVASTMGAGGKFVLIEAGMDLMPHPTKDGVTVANSIYGRNSFEEMGVKMVKNAANQTVRDHGDGTTLTSVLTKALVNEGYKFLEGGGSYVQVNKDLDLTAEIVRKEIEKLKQPTTYEYKKHIATISANGDEELGTMIADIYEELGDDVVVTVKEGASDKTTRTITKGFVLDRGWSLPYFANPDSNVCSFQNGVNVLIVRGRIDVIQQIQKIVEPLIAKGESLVIVTDDIEEVAMRSLVKARTVAGAKICVVISPDQGNGRKDEVLEDLAVSVGAKALDLKSGVNDYKFGRVEEIVISSDKSVFIGFDANNNRLQELKEKYQTSDELEKKFLQERISNLNASTAEIVVGGRTDLEIKERKDRVDDAVHAVKSALKHGYVAGGGTTMFYVSQKLQNKVKTDGGKILLEALKAPMKQILANAEIVAPEKVTYGKGINVRTRKKEDFFKNGVVDSAGVLIGAMNNALSVAKIVLSTDYLLLSEDEKNI